MPDVTGKRLDVALSDIERAGFTDTVDIVGGGLLGVLDESNWQVCDQSPAAGQPVSAAPHLTVDRSCGDDGGELPTEGAGEPSGEPADADPAILTLENNQDLAAILTDTDYCSDTIADFAAKYDGRTIQFDGHIGAMNNHGDYATRYDILVGAGDFSETAAPGPAFQFRDVNTTYDLHFTGSNLPDRVGVGNNLRVIARVEAFESASCLFLLEPISTEFR